MVGMSTMRVLLLALAFAAATASARAGDEFRDQRDSFRSSFSDSGAASDRLAAVEAVSTFGTEDSTELLVSGIPVEMGFIEALAERREAIRTGRDKSLRGRAPEPYLLNLKEELDAEYRVLAAIEEGLGKLTDRDAIEYLSRVVLLRDRTWKSREIAARALARIGDRDQLPLLVKGLRDKDARVRTAVLLALGRMRAEEAFDDVREAMDEKDWMVRSAAIETLGLIADPRGFEPLLERMEEEDGRLAEDCAQALKRITGQDFGRSSNAWRRWWADHRERALAGERFDLPEEEEKPGEDDGYYYGIPVVSRLTVFIIDVSGSMEYSTTEFTEKPAEGEPSRLDVAKRELLRAIEQYDPKGKFGLIAFHSVVMVWRPRVVPASPPMKSDAKEWTEELEPTGTTNIYGALEAAFGMAGMGLGDRYYEPAVDTIFLLSDGAPTNEDLSDDDPARILRAVREWNRLGRVKIHTVGLKGHSADFMSRLATENGGTYTSRD